MTDYLNNSNRTTLLFKKFQNITQAAIDVTGNGTGGTSFFNEQKNSLNNIYNTDIFIENIQRNLLDKYKLLSLERNLFKSCSRNKQRMVVNSTRIY